MIRNKFRIVSDHFLGYEVQTKYWFIPFIWFEKWAGGISGITNTFSSLDEAKKWIKDGCPKNEHPNKEIIWQQK